MRKILLMLLAGATLLVFSTPTLAADRALELAWSGRSSCTKLVG